MKMAEFRSQCSSEAAPPQFPPQKKKSRSVAKQAADKERNKTRVNVGAAFPRWRALRAAKGLQVDSELALLLLDVYEQSPLASKTPGAGLTSPEVSNRDEVSASDRLRAAMDPEVDLLPLTAADQTIHQEMPPPPPEPHDVLSQEEVIGPRASIAYEDNIHQLAALVHLPVKQCPHTSSTGLLCPSFPPFDRIIRQRCTSFVVEWVCPLGHVVWSWTSQPTFKFGMLAGDLMLGMNILLSGNSYSKVALLFRFMNMGVVSPATFHRIQRTYCADMVKTVREFWTERRSEAGQQTHGSDVVVSGLPSDVQKVIVGEEEQPDQEDPEPPHIKEEQEELWTSQDGEQLQGLEEADIKFLFTPVPVKSEEEDEEKPQSSQLHHRLTEQMETEADGEDCGGPEPVRNSDPDAEDTSGESSETETEISDNDRTETREPQSGSNSLKNEVPVSDSGGKPFNCSECGKRFGSKVDLKRHVRSHTGEKPFSCSVCKKSFAQRGTLQNHMRIHTGEKPFSCSDCDQRFTWIYQLRSHQCVGGQSAQLHEEPQSGSNSVTNEDVPVSDSRCSTGEKPFSCSECGKRFGMSGHLTVHMRTHTGEKPFSCSLCKKSFTERGTLRTHMKIHTGEKPFHCSVCGKGFTVNGNLKKHMRIHTGEKPFSCSVCDERFLCKAQLTTHMVRHTGEKPFSCSVCKRSFALNGNLQQHMKIHTGEKPFRCSVCGKGFIGSGNLNIHMRRHTGEKPFSCSVCGKAFIGSGDLKIHMRIHTGEKPFSCSVCDKVFSDGGNLKAHMKRHSQRKKFSCGACEQRFTWLYQLRIHECVGGQSSQLHHRHTEQMETEAGGEDCGGPEPEPDPHLQSDTEDKSGDSSETEVSDGDWKETREPQAGSDSDDGAL